MFRRVYCYYTSFWNELSQTLNIDVFHIATDLGHRKGLSTSCIVIRPYQLALTFIVALSSLSPFSPFRPIYPVLTRSYVEVLTDTPIPQLSPTPSSSAPVALVENLHSFLFNLYTNIFLTNWLWFKYWYEIGAHKLYW